MNLAQIKTSDISKRRLFQIERAIVREVTDLWCMEKSYFIENFAEDVDVEFKGRRIKVAITNKGRMKHGSPEATVNEMMRGLILTMTSDQVTGKLLKNHEAIIGNILDVFVHRLKEIGERKFIFQRLQTLELGFGITFGLDKEFYPIRKARRFLEDVLTGASLSTADETAETLIHDMLATEALGQKEHGMTFHIVMEKENEASFISLPFGMTQANYVSLLGTHTLRCNILGELEGLNIIKTGILRIDAPTRPVSFIRHKGFYLPVDEKVLMEKLGANKELLKKDFTGDELSCLKLLFNEYVQLAFFLLRSGRIDPGLRLIIIFPRINIFKILHEENPAVPIEEPQTLGELASLHSIFFRIQKPHEKKSEQRSRRIPERVIQEKVVEAIQALARNTIENIYNPVTEIRKSLVHYTQKEYNDPYQLITIRERVEGISSYLKKFKSIQRVVLDENGKDLDIEASIMAETKQEPLDALEEIVGNIQAAEIEHIKEVIVSKMLDYLSFITVRLEQVEKVSSAFIKQEIIKEIESYTSSILLQAKSFYDLMMGRTERRKH
jgi:hypothetical protein